MSAVVDGSWVKSLIGAMILAALAFAGTASGSSSVLNVGALQSIEPTSPDMGSSSRAEARARAEAFRTDRRLQARPTEVFAPYYTTADPLNARLIVLNSITDPVTVELAALRLDHGILPLGSYRIEPNRHLDIPLDDLVGLSPGFESGSLRLSFLGDATTLQSWLVLEQGAQVVELPLVEPTTVEGAQTKYFWSAPSLDSSARPTLHLYNRSGQATAVSLRISDGSDEATEARKLLVQSGELRSVAVERGSGWLSVSHDGEPGDLLASALLVGTETLNRIAASGPHEKATVWESLPVAGGRGSENRKDSSSVLLFNSGAAQLGVTLESVSPTGEQLGRRALLLDAEKVVRVAVAADPGTRIRVTANDAGLLVDGSTIVDESGTTRPLTFFAREEAHASGNYPLLPLESHEVSLLLVNLDRSVASIVAQFYWQDGTYAYGPFDIPGGATVRLSVEEIVAQSMPDLLGRVLPEELPHAFLKWKVHSGPRAMLGRVEAQPRSSQDAFGFNCTGCCWETPYGSIEPSFVDFEHGQSVSFQACVNYDTCSGEMGPYPAYSISTTVPSPFSWDGTWVSASAAAEADLSFSAWDEELQPPDCFSFQVPYDAIGVASACKALLKKAHNPLQFWSAAQACTLQVGGEPAGTKCSRCQSCCNAQKAHSTCKRKLPQTVQSEYNVCITHCETDHCQ